MENEAYSNIFYLRVTQICKAMLWVFIQKGYFRRKTELFSNIKVLIKLFGNVSVVRQEIIFRVHTYMNSVKDYITAGVTILCLGTRTKISHNSCQL
jgi:hypothetical protein